MTQFRQSIREEITSLESKYTTTRGITYTSLVQTPCYSISWISEIIQTQGLDDLCRSLTAQTILWFYDSVNVPPTVKSHFQWVKSNLQQENCCYTKKEVKMRMCGCWPAAGGLPTALRIPQTYGKGGTWLPMLPPSFKEKRRLPFSKSNLKQCMFSEGVKAREMTKPLDPHLIPCRSSSFRASSWILEHLPVLENHILPATLLLPCKHTCSSDWKLWTSSIIEASIWILPKGKQQNSGTAFLFGC